MCTYCGEYSLHTHSASGFTGDNYTLLESGSSQSVYENTDYFSTSGASDTVAALLNHNSGNGLSWDGAGGVAPVAGTAVSISWRMNFENVDRYGSYTLDSGEQAAIRDSLARWSEYANITFTEVNSGTADMGFSKGSLPDYGSGGYVAGVAHTAYYANGNIAYSDVYVTNHSLTYDEGDFGWNTVIHEIGHALGLKHPGDYNGNGSGLGPFLPSGEDNTDLTVMSYYSSGYNPWTAMLYDIAAIQYLYGANHTYNSGDNIYTLGTAGRKWAIWDGNGTDTLTTSATSSNNVIDLREGKDYYSTVGSEKTWVAFGANIENAIGGSGNDTIYGNSLVNAIQGNGGNDSIQGGAGTDSAIYLSAYSEFTITIVDTNTVQLADNNTSINEGTDIVDDIEEFIFNGITYLFNGISLLFGDLHTFDGDGSANRLYAHATEASLMNGLGGNDSLFGLAAADEINGGAGADIIYGGAENDTLDGGTENDSIYGEAGNDTIIGGDGTDRLEGDADDDSITGDAGADTLGGGEGDDTLRGGADGDLIYGDPAATGSSNGHDLIYGGDGNDDIYGQFGNDTIEGEAGLDTIRGGNGNDSITGGTDVDQLRGDDGNDTITGDAGNDTLQGGAGNDSLSGGTENDSITGGDGDDYITGGTGADSIAADEGADTVYGDAGADTIYGGLGADTIFGGAENDMLYGEGYWQTTGSGSDSISGEAGNDTLYGYQGNDTLAGGDDDDRLEGGDGDDSLTGDNGNDNLYGGLGSDTITGGIGNDRLEGEFYWDVTGSDDTLNGGDGNDTMLGYAGDDSMNGGIGSDALYGYGGQDIYTGGAGNDFFYFLRATDSTDSDRDIITDYTKTLGNRDVINLRGVGVSNFSQLTITQDIPGNKTIIDHNISTFSIELTGLVTLTSGDFVF